MVNEIITAPLPWQMSQWQRLTNSVNQNKVAHALLLSGQSGVGKHQFARAFCNRLLCRSPGESGACGQCKACHLLAAGHHPDFHWVTLEEKSQALKIDQIRALVVSLAKTPQLGSRHCVILDPADCLNINAANALLKLLEEPPGEALIILISAYPHRMVATLRSRCQQVQFPVPADSLALHWLMEKGIEREEAISLLTLARGAPLQALHLQQAGGLEDYEAIAKQLAGVLSRRTNVVEVAGVFAGRANVEVIDAMLDWLQRLASVKLASNDSIHLPKVLAAHFSGIEDLQALFRFYDKLSTAKSYLLSTANPNKQLLWEECLLDWQALTKPPSHTTSGTPNLAN